MKAILFIASVMGAFAGGVLIGRNQTEAVLMAIATGMAISIFIVIPAIIAVMAMASRRHRVSAYVVSEKREPVSVNHRLSGGQR